MAKSKFTIQREQREMREGGVPEFLIQAGVTPSEFRVIACRSYGLSIEETAAQIGVSRDTVRDATIRVFKKLNLEGHRLDQLIHELYCRTYGVERLEFPDWVKRGT